jgi:hypothetical protein
MISLQTWFVGTAVFDIDITTMPAWAQ